MGSRSSRTIIASALAIVALLRCGPAHAIDAALIEAAKREGEVVWYSTQIINQLVRPIAAAFEKKYPGIKVRYTRANATEVAVKILNESRAGRKLSFWLSVLAHRRARPAAPWGRRIGGSGG